MLKGLFWDFLGKIFSQGFSFIASIFLARLLLPEDFGLIAIALVLINISQVFIDAGFGAALIQRKEVSDKLYSSVFWLNISIGAILTLVFIFISGWIADIYKAPNLKLVLQYFSLAFLINSFGVIQRTQLIKKMDFKRLSLISAISTFLSGAIAIFFAYQTKSYWALVIQQLSFFGFSTILLWIVNSWKPKPYFSFESLRSVWGFSSRKFSDDILTSIINSVDTIMIGKLFPTYSLGLYSRAKNLSEMVRSYSSSGVASVVFPAISRIQNEKKNVEQLFLRMNAAVAIFSVALALFLFLFAEPLILFLYTAKWAGSIFFFQIFILSSFLHPINAISMSTLNGLGHIKVTFNYGLIKKFLRLMSFIIALQFGINAFAIAISISVVLIFLLNAQAVKKTMDIGYKTQLRPIVLNVSIAVSVYFLCVGYKMIIDSSNQFFYLGQFSLAVLAYIILQQILNNSILIYWQKKLIDRMRYVSQRKKDQ